MIEEGDGNHPGRLEVRWRPAGIPDARAVALGLLVAALDRPGSTHRTCSCPVVC